MVRQAWSSVWVAGEVQRVRPHRNGHLYLELVEKGERDSVTGSLSGVVWRGQLTRIRRALQSAGVEFTEGVQIRCHGSLDFYPPHGRVQFVIDDVDPVFTEGRLEQRRRETLRALEASGLLERNREQSLSILPLRVGLVTSEGSAAFHDFLTTLKQSNYPFEVSFVHSLVQGGDAESQIVSAVGALSRRELDCIALIRGGGSRSDLSVFDSQAVAEAVAMCPLPVLTGLGHEIDLSIADRVAHTALKTPTGVGEFLVQRVAVVDRRLRQIEERLVARSREQLRHGEQRLHAAWQSIRSLAHRVAVLEERTLRLSDALRRSAQARLRSASAAVAGTRRVLARRAFVSLQRGRAAPERIASALTRAGRARLQEARTRLDGWSRLVEQLSPERTLSRGFSVTRTAGGAALRDAQKAPPGSRIETQLYRGRLVSRVEET